MNSAKASLSPSLRFQAELVDPDAVCEMPTSRLRALLRDFTTLLGQQMYFWGRDVVYPQGNLLCKYGFDRRQSEGLEGTSCYRKDIEGHGFVELHGACAGHYAGSAEEAANFLYIRNKNHCYLHSGEEPPAPGYYAPESLHDDSALDLYFASLPFLDWWLEYEKWITEGTSTTWREKAYIAFASLPASRPSLPPQEAIRWLHQYRQNPMDTARLCKWMRSCKAR